MPTDTTPNPVGSASGLLGQWIARRLGEYAEPTRTMRPAGVPVAYSRKKYHATLLALTAESPASQAARLGISRAQLYNWQGEPAFKATVSDLAARFAGLVRVYAVEVAQRPEPESSSWLAEAVFETDGTPVFSDATSYGPPVLEALTRLRDRETDEGVKLELHSVVMAAVTRTLEQTTEGRALLLAHLRPLWWEAAGALVNIVLDHLVPTDGRTVPTRDEAIQAAARLRKDIADRWRIELPADLRAQRAAYAAFVEATNQPSRNGHVVPSHIVTETSTG